MSPASSGSLRGSPRCFLLSALQNVHGRDPGTFLERGGWLRSFMGKSLPLSPDSVQDKHLLFFICGLTASSQPHTPVTGELSGGKNCQRPF